MSRMDDANMKKHVLKVISLFSGCGGKDLGFLGKFAFLGKRYKKLPYKLVWANDINPDACETNRTNILKDIICGDIKDARKKGLPKGDVVIGGFPCQDFSVAGKRLGTKTDRGNLYLEMKKVIKNRKPSFFVAENVGGLLNIRNENGLVIDQIRDSFEELGYNVKIWYLNAADYGVPQHRRRVFIVGAKKSLKMKLTLPPIPKAFVFKYITAKEAIGDLWGKRNKVFNQDQVSKARNYGSHCQGNRPIRADKPSPTIRAEHHGNIEFHYKNSRRLTVRECARLQSFPDNFVFKGSTSSAYKQVGNAVPPVLAWNIAKHLYDLYKKRP